MDDQKFMSMALKEAAKALKTRDVPIGSVSVKDGRIIAKAHNKKEKNNDATCHAEMLCLKKTAKKLKNWRLNTVTIYTTLEPCPMCASAMVLARVKSLVYGAADPKGGAAGSIMNLADNKKLNHRLEVKSGVMEKECSQLIKDFFKQLRQSQKTLNPKF